jgi:hypothetical protein
MPTDPDQRLGFSQTLASWILYCLAIGGAFGILSLTWGRGFLAIAGSLAGAAVLVFVLLYIAARIARARHVR